MALLPAVELQTRPEPTATVIWLHGLGADGHDFEAIVPELQLDDLAVRFIFPHAPSIPVTVNGGMRMPAWYDITAIDIDRTIDTAQLEASADAVDDFIARERERGIDSRRIVIAGFSQGGAVAYEAALRHPEALGGLLALSTYFATEQTNRSSDANKGIAVLACHGTLDPVVPETLGSTAVETLKSRGYQVDYHTYPMQHAVDMAEIRDIAAWLRQRLTAPLD